MALTARAVLDIASEQIGAHLPGWMGGLRLVNEAGRHLASMKKWDWLESRGTDLSVSPGQEYIPLPGDFRELVEVRVPGINTFSTQPAVLEELLALRARNTPYSSHHIFYAAQHREIDGRPTPVLELYPLPSAGCPSTLRVLYRGGWTEVESDDQTLYLPLWCETLYLELVTAFVRARKDPQGNTLGERLADVRDSGIFVAAADHDASTQSNLGTLTGYGMRTAQLEPQAGYAINPIQYPSPS